MKLYTVVVDITVILICLTALYFSYEILKEWKRENGESDSLPARSK